MPAIRSACVGLTPTYRMRARMAAAASGVSRSERSAVMTRPSFQVKELTALPGSRRPPTGVRAEGRVDSVGRKEIFAQFWVTT